MSSAPPASSEGLDFYSVKTPNGLKVNIALEELNALGTPIKFKEHSIDFGKNEQKEPWFLEICPNGRIPAVIDRSNNNLAIWETGSILRYIAEKYDTEHKLHFDNLEDQTEMYNWVFFQHGGYGPMIRQAGHFLNAAPEKVPYAAKRYLEESARLLDVYEKRLSQGDREYLVGKGKGKFSYADIVIFPWIRAHPYSLGLASLEKDYPNIVQWMDRISAREGTKKAIEGDMVEKIKSKEGWEEETEKKREWVYAKA
ncbi:glutathione S-transferase family protein [Sporobolomyces salmoneus]|uniref:glutathione S-transferase family protein n=1 Tax=Sporobolomyces salmoneus TaxID=183962 RepID=UPI0031745132